MENFVLLQNPLAKSINPSTRRSTKNISSSLIFIAIYKSPNYVRKFEVF